MKAKYFLIGLILMLIFSTTVFAQCDNTITGAKPQKEILKKGYLALSKNNYEEAYCYFYRSLPYLYSIRDYKKLFIISELCTYLDGYSYEEAGGTPVDMKNTVNYYFLIGMENSCEPSYRSQIVFNESESLSRDSILSLVKRFCSPSSCVDPEIKFGLLAQADVLIRDKWFMNHNINSKADFLREHKEFTILLSKVRSHKLRVRAGIMPMDSFLKKIAPIRPSLKRGVPKDQPIFSNTKFSNDEYLNAELDAILALRFAELYYATGENEYYTKAEDCIKRIGESLGDCIFHLNDRRYSSRQYRQCKTMARKDILIGDSIVGPRWGKQHKPQITNKWYNSNTTVDNCESLSSRRTLKNNKGESLEHTKKSQYRIIKSLLQFSIGLLQSKTSPNESAVYFNQAEETSSRVFSWDVSYRSISQHYLINQIHKLSPYFSELSSAQSNRIFVGNKPVNKGLQMYCEDFQTSIPISLYTLLHRFDNRSNEIEELINYVYIDGVHDFFPTCDEENDDLWSDKLDQAIAIIQSNPQLKIDDLSGAYHWLLEIKWLLTFGSHIDRKKEAFNYFWENTRSLDSISAALVLYEIKVLELCFKRVEIVEEGNNLLNYTLIERVTPEESRRLHNEFEKNQIQRTDSINEEIFLIMNQLIDVKSQEVNFGNGIHRDYIDTFPHMGRLLYLYHVPDIRGGYHDLEYNTDLVSEKINVLLDRIIEGKIIIHDLEYIAALLSSYEKKEEYTSIISKVEKLYEYHLNTHDPLDTGMKKVSDYLKLYKLREAVFEWDVATARVLMSDLMNNNAIQFGNLVVDEILLHYICMLYQFEYYSEAAAYGQIYVGHLNITHFAEDNLVHSMMVISQLELNNFKAAEVIRRYVGEGNINSSAELLYLYRNEFLQSRIDIRNKVLDIIGQNSHNQSIKKMGYHILSILNFYFESEEEAIEFRKLGLGVKTTSPHYKDIGTTDLYYKGVCTFYYHTEELELENEIFNRLYRQGEEADKQLTKRCIDEHASLSLIRMQALFVTDENWSKLDILNGVALEVYKEHEEYDYASLSLSLKLTSQGAKNEKISNQGRSDVLDILGNLKFFTVKMEQEGWKNSSQYSGNRLLAEVFKELEIAKNKVEEERNTVKVLNSELHIALGKADSLARAESVARSEANSLRIKAQKQTKIERDLKEKAKKQTSIEEKLKEEAQRLSKVIAMLAAIIIVSILAIIAIILKSYRESIKGKALLLDQKDKLEKQLEINKIQNEELALKNKKIVWQQNEMTHRVINNLKNIKSILTKRMSKSEGDIKDELRKVREFIISALRIQGLMHKMKKNKIGNLEFVNELAKKSAGFGEVDCNVDVDEGIPLGRDDSYAIGVIVNEVITNSTKHAFRGIENPNVFVRLYKSGDNTATLEVGDNGIGINPDVLKTKSNGESLGMTLIRQNGVDLDPRNGVVITNTEQGMVCKVVFEYKKSA